MTKRLKKEIWVYGDLRNERLLGLSLNVLAKARELALSIGGKVAVTLLGSSAESVEASPAEGTIPFNDASEACISHGADLVYILTHKSLTIPRADLYAPALAAAVRKERPLLVLFPLTDFGRELTARAAGINQTGLIAECVDLWFAEEKIGEMPLLGG